MQWAFVAQGVKLGPKEQIGIAMDGPGGCCMELPGNGTRLDGGELVRWGLLHGVSCTMVGSVCIG